MSPDAIRLCTARRQVQRGLNSGHPHIAFFWSCECRLIAARLIARGC